MTLLEAITKTDGTEAQVIAQTAAALESGNLVLTGNFRGREAELAAQVRG